MDVASSNLRVAVIGAGMAGILAAIRLRGARIDDVTIYEKGDRYGGTWRENTYPGIACDVPSHLYSYSFEPNPDWSHRFSPGEEIQAYFERVARKHRLDELTRFGEEVVACRFVDGRWELETGTGGSDTADVVIAATGVLHHPNDVEFDGLASFAGHAFHSARWDHAVQLAGRRVGIVGTGSSAVQITAAVVDEVAALTLFQRTAQWIMPQRNPPYSDEEREAFRRDPELMVKHREEWSQLFTGGISNSLIDADSPEMRLIEDMCRANLEESVTDPLLREQLRPDYRAACKRLVISPSFYDAIQRPNARLVTDRIERIEPGGVRTADGTLHELDVLVLATGFRVDRFVRPTVVTGRNGLDLDEVWADGPIAYRSLSVPGFPNFFMLNGPNGPVGNFSLIEVAERQMDYVLQLINMIRSDGARSDGARSDGARRAISATAEATARFEAERRAAAQSTIWMTGCRSWYLDRHGVPATWPWTFDRFRSSMASVEVADFELT